MVYADGTRQISTEQVFKRLNAFATGMREIVLDPNARKFYNIDEEKVVTGKKGGDGRTQQLAEVELGRQTLQEHEVRKVRFTLPFRISADAGANCIASIFSLLTDTTTVL